MTEENKDLQAENRSHDKAGIGQTDEEKGIAPREKSHEKRKKLEEEGKAKKRPNFNGDLDEDLPPLKLED